MKRLRLCPGLRAMVFLTVWLPALLFLSSADCRAGDERLVLLLNSYSFDQQWTRSITRSIMQSLEEVPDVRLIVEFMDSKRYHSQEYFDQLYHLFKRKYSETKFDVIITSDDNAADFALKHRDDVFHDTPVIFCGVNNHGILDREGFVNITGVLEAPGVADTLELVYGLHPDLEALYVINESETVSGKKDREFLNKYLNAFKDKFKIIWWEDLPEAELKSRLAELDSKSAVLLLSFFPDKKSGAFKIEEGARFVSSFSPRPVYSMWEYFLGKGIVGGMLTSGTWQGKTAAEMALMVLDGIPPEEIPVRSEAANRFMFDREMMDRFKISPSDLPAGSIVINQKDSMLRKNRLQLAIAAVVIAFLTIVCAALVANNRARRKAEMESADARQSLEDLLEKLTLERDQLKKVESEIRRSEGRFRSIFELSPLALWEEDLSGLLPMFEDLRAQGVTDFRDHFRARPEDLEACLRVIRVVDVNKAAVEMHGALDKMHLLDNISKTFTDYSWEVFAEELDALARGERSFFSEIQGQTLCGEPLECMLYLQVLDGYEVSLERALLTLVDVTEKKRFQETMIQTEKMVSVGGLAAGMAHEINNPLGVVLQAVQGTVRRLSPDLAKNVREAEKIGIDLTKLQDYLECRGITGYLDGIREAGVRASAIVRNMLDFSRKSESRRSPQRIDAVLDRAVEFVSGDYSLKTKYDMRKVEFVREYEAGLPEVMVTQTEMEQVFLNLIKNSAQALFAQNGSCNGDPHRIVLRAYRRNCSIRVEVEDNGPGMSEDIKKRVFEPFFTTKQPGEGTGLGLSVSYFIVTRNHGGVFQVESSPGRGARFVIDLPLEGV